MEKNDQLQVKIITPNGLAHKSLADSVTAPATNGTVSILPHHIPFFTPLDAGEIIVRLGDKKEFFAITGGFMDVNSGGVVTILTDSAQRSADIDEKSSLRAQEAAQKILSQREKLSARDFAQAEASLRKSILELKIAGKRKYKSSPTG